MKKLPAAVLLCLLALACNRNDGAKNGNGPQPYFDLKSYFAGQISALEARSPAVRKRIKVNGKTEEKDLRDADFAGELSIFQRYDINKPAWIDQYQIDSLFEGGQLTGIRYTAKKDDLKIRKVEVDFAGDTVQEVSIFNEVRSTTMNVSQELHYRAGKAYSIVNLQKLAFSKEKRVAISADFTEGI